MTAKFSFAVNRLSGRASEIDTMMQMPKKNESWVLPVALVLTLAVTVVLYWDFLTGKALYLYTVSDGFTQYLPLYRDLVRAIASGEFSQWNMSIGFGAPENYTLMLYPLNLLPILLGVQWGETAMIVGFAWMQVLKILLATLFMWLFLRKLSFSPYICTVMSIAYSFSGIMILRGNWRFPADECFLAVLLLWCVERYFREGKWRLLPLGVALLVSCMGLYGAYLYTLLLFLYATARFIYAKRPAKAYMRFLLPAAGLYALGVLLCALILIGFNWTMFQAARFDSTASYMTIGEWLRPVKSGVLAFGALSSVNVNLTGCFDLYIGPLNYLERPILFCGVGSLFLIIQAFWLGEKKVRRLMAAAYGLIAAYMLFPAVMDIFNAFIRNEELGQRSYRLSTLWILLVMVVSAAYGLKLVIEKRASAAGTVLTGGGLLAALVGYGFFAPRFAIETDRPSYLWVVAMAAGWTLLLLLGGVRKLRAQGGSILAAVLLLMMLADMTYNAYGLIQRSEVAADVAFEQMSAKDMGYYSGVGEALAQIREMDSDLYRIWCDRPDDTATYCYPLYFGVFDSSYYTNIGAGTYAFLNEVYPESFISDLGTKYSSGVGDDPALSALFGYRYLVRPVGSGEPVPANYILIKTVDSHEIYANQTPLSVGLLYDSYIRRSEFQKLEDLQQRMILLHCLVVEDDAQISGTCLTAEEAEELLWVQDLDALLHERQAEQLEVTDWKQDEIRGTVTVGGNSEKILFVSIPNVYGWKALVDGRATEIHRGDLGFIVLWLDPGTHTIDLIYRPATLPIGVAISVAAIVTYLWLVWMQKNHERRTRRTIPAEKARIL